MNLIEFRNIDISTEKGVDDVFGYIEEYLNELIGSKGSLEALTKYDEIIKKFYQCIDHYNIELDDLQQHLIQKHEERIYHTRTIRLSGHGGFHNGNNIYNDLRNIVLDSYEKTKATIADSNGDFIFNRLLDNNTAAKEKMIFLLNNSVKLIESNPTIPDKAKVQIVDNITSAINEAKSDKTNWSKFLGKVTQAIMLLAAVAAITGYTLKDITEAQEHLENVVNIVHETTVNNIKVTNELNIQNNIQIGDTSDKKQIDEPKE